MTREQNVESASVFLHIENTRDTEVLRSTRHQAYISFALRFAAWHPINPKPKLPSLFPPAPTILLPAPPQSENACHHLFVSDLLRPYSALGVQPSWTHHRTALATVDAYTWRRAIPAKRRPLEDNTRRQGEGCTRGELNLVVAVRDGSAGRRVKRECQGERVCVCVCDCKFATNRLMSLSFTNRTHLYKDNSTTLVLDHIPKLLFSVMVCY